MSYETQLEVDLPIVVRNASFSLTSTYPRVRTLLDHLINQQKNLTMGALDCIKDDIDAVDVHCNLTLTAFQMNETKAGELSHVP